MLDMKQYGITPFGAVPSERQLAHYEMKKAFFHFGVNTFTDAEWGNGDVIREFTDTCRKFGIKVGVYLSPWDRNAPFWGTSDYSKYYAKQLTELLTEYVEIHEVWWDGAGSAETPYDWGLWASIIRKNQPNACIFGSMGATLTWRCAG